MSKLSFQRQDDLEAEELYQKLMAEAISSGVITGTISSQNDVLRGFVRKWVRNTRTDAVRLTVDHGHYTLGIRLRPPMKTHKGSGGYNHQKRSAFLMLNEGTLEYEIAFMRDGSHENYTEAELLASFRSILKSPKSSRIQLGKSTDELKDFILDVLKRMNNLHDSYFDKMNRIGKFKRREKLIDITRRVLIEWAEEKFTSAFEEFAAQLNSYTMEFTKVVLSKAPHPHQRRMVVELYNHFQSVSKNERAYDNRLGAADILSRTGFLFLDKKEFWSEIDEGFSVHDTLANHFGINKITIKHALKRLEFFDVTPNTEKLKELVEGLNLVPSNFWPTDTSDLPFFLQASKISHAVKDIFSLDSSEYMMTMAKELKKYGTWQGILDERIKIELTDAQANFDDSLKSHPSFYIYEVAVNKKIASFKDIADMKADISKRIILPRVILGFEQQGYKILKTDVVESIVQKISDVIWSVAPISEQMSASSYWHSPRVRISDRFESKVLSSTGNGINWKSFYDKEKKLKCGAVLVPLTSDLALKEEARIMDHCIWSYTSSCIKRGYHAFHVKDKDGNPLSTLTVIDYMQQGKRRIKSFQNRSIRNHNPVPLAHEAEKELLELINKERFVPDWQAIDASKASYLEQEIENTIGYNFRNIEAFQSVFDVYEPCLPRKILSQLGRNGHTFFDRLQDSYGQTVDNMIGAFLDDPEKLMQGGIMLMDAPEIIDPGQQIYSAPQVA